MIKERFLMEYKYWNQLDYPDIPYGEGDTVADSGCGLCSACMVGGHRRT